MSATPDLRSQFSYAQHQARRLRALAEECRSVARAIQLRPDRERVLEMAQQHDAAAALLEVILGPER